MAGVLEGMKDELGYKSFFGNKKEGGKSLLDLGGKMAIDFRQYTIRQLPR